MRRIDCVLYQTLIMQYTRGLKGGVQHGYENKRLYPGAGCGEILWK